MPSLNLPFPSTSWFPIAIAIISLYLFHNDKGFAQDVAAELKRALLKIAVFTTLLIELLCVILQGTLDLTKLWLNFWLETGRGLTVLIPLGVERARLVIISGKTQVRNMSTQTAQSSTSVAGTQTSGSEPRDFSGSTAHPSDNENNGPTQQNTDVQAPESNNDNGFDNGAGNNVHYVSQEQHREIKEVPASPTGSVIFTKSIVAIDNETTDLKSVDKMFSRLIDNETAEITVMNEPEQIQAPVSDFENKKDCQTPASVKAEESISPKMEKKENFDSDDHTILDPEFSVTGLLGIGGADDLPAEPRYTPKNEEDVIAEDEEKVSAAIEGNLAPKTENEPLNETADTVVDLSEEVITEEAKSAIDEGVDITTSTGAATHSKTFAEKSQKNADVDAAIDVARPIAEVAELSKPENESKATAIESAKVATEAINAEEEVFFHTEHVITDPDFSVSKLLGIGGAEDLTAAKQLHASSLEEELKKSERVSADTIDDEVSEAVSPKAPQGAEHESKADTADAADEKDETSKEEEEEVFYHTQHNHEDPDFSVTALLGIGGADDLPVEQRYAADIEEVATATETKKTEPLVTDETVNGVKPDTGVAESDEVENVVKENVTDQQKEKTAGEFFHTEHVTADPDFSVTKLLGFGGADDLPQEQRYAFQTENELTGADRDDKPEAEITNKAEREKETIALVSKTIGKLSQSQIDEVVQAMEQMKETVTGIPAGQNSAKKMEPGESYWMKAYEILSGLPGPYSDLSRRPEFAHQGLVTAEEKEGDDGPSIATPTSDGPDKDREADADLAGEESLQDAMKESRDCEEKLKAKEAEVVAQQNDDLSDEEFANTQLFDFDDGKPTPEVQRDVAINVEKIDAAEHAALDDDLDYEEFANTQLFDFDDEEKLPSNLEDVTAEESAGGATKSSPPLSTEKFNPALKGDLDWEQKAKVFASSPTGSQQQMSLSTNLCKGKGKVVWKPKDDVELVDASSKAAADEIQPKDDAGALALPEKANGDQVEAAKPKAKKKNKKRNKGKKNGGAQNQQDTTAVTETAAEDSKVPLLKEDKPLKEASSKEQKAVIAKVAEQVAPAKVVTPASKIASTASSPLTEISSPELAALSAEVKKFSAKYADVETQSKAAAQSTATVSKSPDSDKPLRQLDRKVPEAHVYKGKNGKKQGSPVTTSRKANGNGKGGKKTERLHLGQSAHQSVSPEANGSEAKNGSKACPWKPSKSAAQNNEEVTSPPSKNDDFLTEQRSQAKLATALKQSRLNTADEQEFPTLKPTVSQVVVHKPEAAKALTTTVPKPVSANDLNAPVQTGTKFPTQKDCYPANPTVEVTSSPMGVQPWTEGSAPTTALPLPTEHSTPAQKPQSKYAARRLRRKAREAAEKQVAEEKLREEAEARAKEERKAEKKERLAAIKEEKKAVVEAEKVAIEKRGVVNGRKILAEQGEGSKGKGQGKAKAKGRK